WRRPRARSGTRRAGRPRGSRRARVGRRSRGDSTSQHRDGFVAPGGTHSVCARGTFLLRVVNRLYRAIVPGLVARNVNLVPSVSTRFLKYFVSVTLRVALAILRVLLANG